MSALACLLAAALPLAAAAAPRRAPPLEFGAPTPLVAAPQPWEAGQYPHTLSILPLDRGGYRYWGWYGLNGGRGLGLARSNDLLHWDKDPGNPLLLDARWPSAVPGPDPGRPEIYLAFTRNYDYDLRTSSAGYAVSLSTSYIVLGVSTDGAHVQVLKTLVPGAPGERRQNPNLFRDPRSGRYHLTYYRGNDKDRYEIVGRSAASPEELDAAADSVLLRSSWTLAAPALLYAPGPGGAPGLYYLLTEVHGRYKDGPSEWMVAAFAGPAPEGPFSTVALPLLTGERGCPFPFVAGGKVAAVLCRMTDARAQAWQLELAVAPLPALEAP
jgi:hypothetical protein